jgi:hypothetical protein
MNVKDRVKQAITLLDKIQAEGRDPTETEKVELIAELISIANQREKELRGEE